jgi:hypothetical protein
MSANRLLGSMTGAGMDEVMAILDAKETIRCIEKEVKEFA